MDATSLRIAAFHLLPKQIAMDMILAIRTNRRIFKRNTAPPKATTIAPKSKAKKAPTVEECLAKLGAEGLLKLLEEMQK